MPFSGTTRTRQPVSRQVTVPSSMLTSTLALRVSGNNADMTLAFHLLWSSWSGGLSLCWALAETQSTEIRMTINRETALSSAALVISLLVLTVTFELLRNCLLAFGSPATVERRFPSGVPFFRSVLPLFSGFGSRLTRFVRSIDQ